MASASQADSGGFVHMPPCVTRYYRHYGREKLNKQVSPSGMASASQADSGGFNSRHLLHIKKPSVKKAFSFIIAINGNILNRALKNENFVV